MERQLIHCVPKKLSHFVIYHLYQIIIDIDFLLAHFADN